MAERKAINCIAEQADGGEPISSAQVVGALLDALKTDHVAKFAAEVQAAIEDSRRPYRAGQVQRVDPAEQKRREIEAKIAELQGQLAGLTAA